MSSSSNSYFSGVSNEIYGKVNAGSVSAAIVTAGSVKTGTINCDSVQISLPKIAIIKPTASASTYDLTTADMSLLARGDVLYQDSGANCIFRLNLVDTAAEALRLLDLFNIPDTTTTRLIRLNRVNTITNFTVSIGGVGGVVYVQYLVAGATLIQQQEFAAANSTRDAYVLVYRGADTAKGEKTIVFDVIGKA